ncbi:MAG: hypothetical protein JW976_11345 [Syntrophaceae bacterium]|nr:hypothetical protein [Syntrophaceae bacterium]
MDEKIMFKKPLSSFFGKGFRMTSVMAVIAVILCIAALTTNADPISKPHEFYDGGIISALEMNSNFDTLYTKVNELDEKTSISAVRVYSSNIITLLTDAYQTIPFNEEVFDTDDMHNTSSNTGYLYAANSGLYLITCHVQFAENGGGLRQVYLRVNGSTLIADVVEPASGVSATCIHLSTVYYLNAGDFVEARARQTSGGNLNLINVNFSTPAFMMVRLASD